MKCPKCNQIVDPKTNEKWFDCIDKEEITATDVLKAIRSWDESAMWLGGHSVLPTELRDAVRNLTN